MTTCIRKCNFGLVLFGKKNVFWLDFLLTFFGKRGRERGKKEKAGCVVQRGGSS